MPEENEINGGQLEGNEPTSQSEPSSEPSVESPVEESVPQEQPTEPTYAMPEKFQGKTPEEIAQAFEALESKFGTQGQKFGDAVLENKTLQNQLQQLYQSGVGKQVQNSQTSLPGNEDKGFGQQENLNDKFWDDPMGSIESAINNYDNRITSRNQQVEQQRLTQIGDVVNAELQVLHSESDGGKLDPAVASMMDYLDKNDPEFQGLDRNPNLTPQMVKEVVRKVHEKALTTLANFSTKGGQVDPETAKAVKAVQKQVAGNSAPAGRANSSTNQEDTPEQKALKDAGWDFLA